MCAQFYFKGPIKNILKRVFLRLILHLSSNTLFPVFLRVLWAIYIQVRRDKKTCFQEYHAEKHSKLLLTTKFKVWWKQNNLVKTVLLNCYYSITYLDVSTTKEKLHEIFIFKDWTGFQISQHCDKSARKLEIILTSDDWRLNFLDDDAFCEWDG